jgi:glyoxylase-like metal-dependent hydrolase (beta-lactamase superfamily II)
VDKPRRINDDITILPSYFPIPGFGLVPVNAFVLESSEPVLVDTGLHQDEPEFMDALRSVIDPSDLRWLWLTHPDQDHVGSLRSVLEEAPRVRLVTTFLGYGVLSLFEAVPLDRVYLVNPGESLDVGDRRLVAYKPPTFDNPATTGLYDTRSRALFSSDCFGALVQAPADDAESIDADDLRQGQVLWTSIDSPWLHKVDESKFAAELAEVRRIEPAHVLSSHLPPAQRLTEVFLSSLAAVPGAEPFVGPNQAALEAMLAGMTQGK